MLLSGGIGFALSFGQLEDGIWFMLSEALLLAISPLLWWISGRRSLADTGSTGRIRLRRLKEERTSKKIWVVLYVIFLAVCIFFTLSAAIEAYRLWSTGRIANRFLVIDVPPPIGRIRPDGSGDEVVLSLPFACVNPHPLLSMSPDARKFVVGFEVKTPSDIWLIEYFDPDI